MSTRLAAGIIIGLLFAASAPARHVLAFFGSPTCKECMHIKERILYPAQKHFPHIDLQIYDVNTDSGFNLLMTMEETYHVPNSSAIELFFPDTFLTGAEDINKHARRLIDRLTEVSDTVSGPDSATYPTDFSHRLAKRFCRYSIISIFIAGIIDGINSCAIATMIFLVSFLATQKRKRREILAIGLAFTAAVFFTYLAMGVGAFKALTVLQRYPWISTAVRWSAAVLALCVGIMSFRDALFFRKSGNASDIKMQLPKAIKLRIHKVISGNLSGGSLVIGAIITGFLVTLLEAVCTGQVYLPTIVLMTRKEGLRLTGWLYLILYNFLFVLPLLVVMLLAFFGLKWDRLAKTTQKHLVLIKVALGTLLCSLAVFIVMAG